MLNNKLLFHYAAGGGGGQGDTEDIARLHIELETKEQELREKNDIVNQLVTEFVAILQDISRDAVNHNEVYEVANDFYGLSHLQF